MGKAEGSKDKRFKILKKTLENSYDNNFINLEDLKKSLKLDDTQILSETRTLESLGCLDKTIRGNDPTWTLTGKARTSMEKNPKNYDEFLDYFEDRLKNSEPIQSPNYESLGWKWTKKSVVFASGGGLLGVITLLLLASSFPSIQVSMYETDDTITKNDNSWSTQNVKITLDEEGSRFNDYSEVCFRVKNAGQNIGPIQIPANNMLVHVSTDAICEDCENNIDVGLLPSQDHRDICDNIRISEGIENFNFQIITQHDAILHYVKTYDYSCNFIEAIESKIMKTKDFAYTCSLE